ncbi:MAG: tyrosine-type recombinase/integrase [Verrucomicrobia bacterium]|nr:tyrosine-type recombinase/integrase [Verrucomicrobiota bacterium]
MALELKPTSGWWYGRFVIEKKIRRFNLGIRVDGVRPKSLRDDPLVWDNRFRKSRQKALVAHDRLLEELQAKRNAEELAQRVLEIKSGFRVKSVKLKELPRKWVELPRKRPASTEYLKQGKKRLKNFVSFLKDKYNHLTDLGDVSAQHVDEYMATQDARGISARTWNIIFGHLKGLFKRFEPMSDAYQNYFRVIPTKAEDTIHRGVFSEEDLKVILKNGKCDPPIRSLIVVACCTGLRRGDCASLKWTNVDLESGFIRTKTTKTNEYVDIPILPLLRSELENVSKRKQKNGVFVFPAAAEIYQKSPSQLNTRLRSILEQSGFMETKQFEKAMGAAKKAKKTFKPLPFSRLKAAALEAINKLSAQKKKKVKMKETLEAYLDGHSLKQVAKLKKLSQSTVSLYLNTIEQQIKAPIIRVKNVEPPKELRGGLYADSDSQRLHRGSARGWHSFRTTFVTQALASGMPIEILRQITGHQTVEVVLKHYFRPGREELRRSFAEAMPSLMNEGKKSKYARIRGMLLSMSSKSWRQDKEQILEILDESRL